MRRLLVVVLSTLAAPVSAQQPVDRAVIAQIKDEGLDRSSRVAELFHHLTNVIGPRLTGSPAFKQAVDWSAERFRELRLANVRTEAWTPSTSGEVLGTPVYIGDLTADQVRARKAERAGKDLTTVEAAASVHHGGPAPARRSPGAGADRRTTQRGNHRAGGTAGDGGAAARGRGGGGASAEPGAAWHAVRPG